MNPFSENESFNKYEFVQLGDAFRFGMSHELPNLTMNEGGVHLYASIAYMYLNGYISNFTASKVYDTLRYNSVWRRKPENVVEDISKCVFEELLDKCHFNNLDNLIEMLNEVKIPEWCFDVGMKLVSKSCEGMFLYNDFLYYIAEEEDEWLFVKLKTDRIDANNDLDSQDCRIVLGCGFYRIYGFDEKLKRIYLCVKNQQEFYQYYDMVSGSFVVCANKLLALNEGIPYIITKDGYFAYVLGDVIHKVKSYKGYEKYVPKKNYFLLTPKDADHTFFYPYCITYDGKVIPADKEDCKNFVWNELEKIVHEDRWNRHSLFSEAVADNSKIPRPNELTINSILKAFNSMIPGSEQCTNKKFVIFEGLCKLLHTYIDSNDDITHLLYILYDVNRIIRKESYDFPSEELYWRFKQLIGRVDVSNQLRDAFQSKDYESVKAIVLGDENYIDDNKFETGLIGKFEFEKKGLKTYTLDKRYGVVIGSQIVPDINLNDFQGIVSYDCTMDRYYVTSVRSITREERMRIVKDFMLPEDKYIFVEQHKEDRVICESSYKKTEEKKEELYEILDLSEFEDDSSEHWEALFNEANDILDVLLNEEIE